MKKADQFDKFHLFQGHLCAAGQPSSSPASSPQGLSTFPAAFAPLLLEHPQTELKYQVFPADHQSSNLLLDAYEIRNTSTRELFYPVLPAPCMCLYFKFGGNAPQAVFCGMTSTLSSLRLPPDHTVFCIRFRPGIADFFTKTSAKKLTNCTFPLNVFLPSASELVRDIQFSEAFAERLFRIQLYFSTHPYISEYEDHALFNRGADMIHRRHGILRVSEVAEALACSERYLCRMFNSWVGVSTKQYCELVQLQFSLREILSRRPKTLAKTAISFGYFDQPHMNRVYQKFLGRTASDMLFFNDASCNISSVSVII